MIFLFQRNRTEARTWCKDQAQGELLKIVAPAIFTILMQAPEIPTGRKGLKNTLLANVYLVYTKYHLYMKYRILDRRCTR